jgi:7,8-dihydropterin-6-yl-methyl-4-(beta-D-ribofuranosyl)aminobenzene 5'-phosphate synthase
MAQYSLPDGVVQLDELELLVVVDNETDILSSVDDGVPQISEVFQHAARTLPRRKFQGYECKEVFDQLCCACHGLSVLVTGCKGRQKRSILFDVGPYPDLWLDNSQCLGVNLSAIECVFLSHWHFDHGGGFPEVISAITNARAAENLPPPVVDLHPDRPDQRGILLPSGLMAMLPEEPTFDEISQTGAQIVTHDSPHPICNGSFFASGEIDRVTDYENGLIGHHSFRGDDGQPDPLIMDERFIAACVKGR